MKAYIERLKAATTADEFYKIELDAERDYEYGVLSEDEYEQVAGMADYLAGKMEG